MRLSSRGSEHTVSAAQSPQRPTPAQCLIKPISPFAGLVVVPSRPGAIRFPAEAYVAFPPSSNRHVELERSGDFPLPAIAIGEEMLLVVVEFLARLGRKFEVGPFHDGVDGTRFLA